MAWLVDGHNRGTTFSVMQLGASNAVASSLEFQGITLGLKETSNISHYICMAHQVNRSVKYASGTRDFRINQNPELAAILKKMHDINCRIYCTEAGLKVLFQVQQEKNW
jgi:hypothetical protein